MTMSKPTWWQVRSLLGGALALPLCWAIETSPILAQDLSSPPTPAQTPASVQLLTLPDCLSIALERQPALAGHRSSVAAAQAQKRGLDELHFASLVSREIPIRRRQACLG